MGSMQLYLLARWISRTFPLLWVYAFAELVADCQYALAAKDREAVRGNLKHVLKTDDVPPALVREVFRNFAKYLVDFFVMTQRIDREFVRTSIEMGNMQALNDVLARGKGGIVVSAHIGNWEMGGVLLPMLGYPLSEVALPHKDPRVNTLFNEQREAFGCKVIPTTVAIRRVMEHLKLNRFVAILAERDFGTHGLLMDFLGKSTMIPKGAALFAFKSGAPFVPVFFLRQPNNRYKVTIHEPIYPPKLKGGKVDDEQIKELMNPYLRLVEQYITENPTQWLMFRPFDYASNIDNHPST